VQNTAASADFASLLQEVSSVFDQSLIVGDEVHGLGATSFQNAMLDF
jgi:superfamily II DNA or RNA helicase